jgi:hypothetical protein
MAEITMVSLKAKITEAIRAAITATISLEPERAIIMASIVECYDGVH